MGKPLATTAVESKPSSPRVPGGFLTQALARVNLARRAAPARVGPDGDSCAPVLYLVRREHGSPRFEAVADDTTCEGTHVVIATHGWFEWEPWPALLALAFHSRVDDRPWCCGWYDWRRKARRLFPSEAARIARYEAGPLLARRLLRLARSWQHVHLIGHSAGAWVVHEAARELAEQTSAGIHVTFLDSYVPRTWDPADLVAWAGDAGGRCWADHYFTRDRIGHFTENVLPHAHNVDITDINPGFNGHHFPRHWYHATILGRYDARRTLAQKEVLCTAAGVPYGFSRALEASAANWQLSTTLRAGGPPVRLMPRS